MRTAKAKARRQRSIAVVQVLESFALHVSSAQRTSKHISGCCAVTDSMSGRSCTAVSQRISGAELFCIDLLWLVYNELRSSHVFALQFP